MPQLEGPTTKIYNYVLQGFGEKKQKKKKKEEEDWQQLLAEVPIFKKIYSLFLFFLLYSPISCPKEKNVLFSQFVVLFKYVCFIDYKYPKYLYLLKVDNSVDFSTEFSKYC